MTGGGGGGHVPYPLIETADFEADIVNKREFRVKLERSGCDSAKPFRLQPVQQFVSAFLVPVTPYKSMMLFHGTGVGKTCAAVQIAEMQNTSRPTLVLVPSSIEGGFANTVYDAKKVPVRGNGQLDVREGSRYQCTGSKYYTEDFEGMGASKLQKSARFRVNKRYEFKGHDKFANEIDRVLEAIQRNFQAVGEGAVEKETEIMLRNRFEGRLIVVDEAHSLRSAQGKKKSSYERLMDVVRACRDVKLVLLSATPMYNDAPEIVDLVNLMLVNDGEAALGMKQVFDATGKITESGKEVLKAATKGRISHMTYEDPAAFPMLLFPRDAGLSGAEWSPPEKTKDGKPIPRAERLPAPTSRGMELYVSEMSAGQREAYERITRATTAASNSELHQIENICYDPKWAESGEKVFLGKAFKKVAGHGTGLHVKYRNPGARYLHPDKLAEHAPKIKAAVDLIHGADGLCFLYSEYKWSGVYPVAMALEEMGYLPYGGTIPLLVDAAGAAGARAPKYILITKEDETDDSMTVTQKVAAANDPASGIKAVLGTETASQGLDFKRVREVHVLEPWWNMSRIRQVIGRGVRRCSHVSLPEEKRNVTVFLHCLALGGGGEVRETRDQHGYRLALNKAHAVKEVEAVLAEAAVDCGLYEMRSVEGGARILTSQKREVETSLREVATPTCDIKWPELGSNYDESTLHPMVYKNMVDLMAWDVREALRSQPARTFDDLKRSLRADEMLLALTLETLLNPVVSHRWLGDKSLVFRSDMYILIPSGMRNKNFTLQEARMGYLFSEALPIGRLE